MGIKALDFMTYNICNVHPSNIRKAGASVEKYGWAARADRVFEVILNAMPTFFCCQELRDQDVNGQRPRHRLETQFYDKLGSKGYDFVFAANNGDALSFKLLTAHKTDQYFHTETFKWWNNSVDPTKFGDTTGNTFGRVTLMTKYYSVKTDEKGVKQPNYRDVPIYVVNTHPGLKHTERMQHHKILIEQAHKIIGLEVAFLAVMGDFNCFPDDGGEEELNLYTKAGFTNVEHLNSSQNISLPIPGTFIGYPAYDKFVPPKGQVGSHLDRIFLKALNMNADIYYQAFADTNKYDGTDKSQPEKISDFLLDEQGEDLRGNFPSDHLPVHALVNIELK